MNVKNVAGKSDGFEVLQTGSKVQTAVMALDPGQGSGAKAEAHEQSEQVLIVLEGEVLAELQDGSRTLKRGDVILIPAGVPHKFTNVSKERCLTFNTYSPPEY